jgi:hypothetical protein
MVVPTAVVMMHSKAPSSVYPPVFMKDKMRKERERKDGSMEELTGIPMIMSTE